MRQLDCKLWHSLGMSTHKYVTHLPTSGVMSGVTGVGDGDLATGLCSKLSANCCLAFCRHATVTLGNSGMVSDA